MLEWLTLSNEDCNKIIAIANSVIAFGAVIGIFSWVKSLRIFIEAIFNIFKKFFINFKNLLVKIKGSIHNWLQEKIVGEENIELLKGLEILKGNKRAIEFLKSFNEEDTITKVNGGYEALMAFMSLYSTKMNFNEFKKVYEDNIKIGELRKEIFEKLIKDILNNNNNN